MKLRLDECCLQVRAVQHEGAIFIRQADGKARRLDPTKCITHEARWYRTTAGQSQLGIESVDFVVNDAANLVAKTLNVSVQSPAVRLNGPLDQLTALWEHARSIPKVPSPFNSAAELRDAESDSPAIVGIHMSKNVTT